MSTDDSSADVKSSHSNDDLSPDSKRFSTSQSDHRLQEERIRALQEENVRLQEEGIRALQEENIRLREGNIRRKEELNRALAEVKALKSRPAVQPQADITSIGTTSTNTTPRKGISVGTTDCGRIDLSLPFTSTGANDLLESAIDDIINEHIEYAELKEKDPTCDDDYHKAQIAAPFLCLLQSTGYGKTRAMLEFARTEKNRHKVVYLLCKDLENWKVPDAVKYILEIESKEEEVLERRWEKFLLCIKETVAAVISSNGDLYRSQITDDFKFGNFYQKLSDNILKRKAPTKSAMRKSSKSDTTKTVNFRDYSDSEAINCDSLVVCFDEASAFDIVKMHCLRRIAKKLGIICMFSDTAASIINQHLRKGDPACSTKGGTLGRFCHPIFAFIPPNFEHRNESDEPFVPYEELFCMGRPRWTSYISKTLKDEDNKIEKLVQLAKNLLLRTSLYDFDQGGNQTLDCTTIVKEVDTISKVSPAMIALFACRYSLGPTSKLSEKLVKYSLATVIGVSEDRDTISCTYPSEPLLASASALLTADKQRLTKVLQHVRAAMHHENKILDPPRGDAGEMCAAAMLGYGMDHIRSQHEEMEKDEYMCEPVELREFLALFNSAAKTNSPSLDNWTVNFTHVVQMFQPPTQTDLELMWKKRMACYVPEGATGLDILIAIYNTVDKCYGTLLVQVKNYKEKITPGEASMFVHELHDISCLPNIEANTPSVSFLLCVNDVESRCRDIGSVPQVKRNVNGNPKNRNLLFELTASFPSTENSPLRDIAIQLRRICETSVNKQCDIDYFFLKLDKELKSKIE